MAFFVFLLGCGNLRSGQLLQSQVHNKRQSELPYILSNLISTRIPNLPHENFSEVSPFFAIIFERNSHMRSSTNFHFMPHDCKSLARV